MTFLDKLVTFFLLVVAVFCLVFQGMFMSDKKGEKVVITVDNKQYATYDFADIEDTQILEIETDYGSNTVVIDKDCVYVREASCPDKLDVKTGKICRQGQMIVCLPNRVMIEITGGERKVDKVTY